MLARVLLHVITTAHGVNAALNRRSFGNRLGGVMKDAALIFISHFDHGYFPFVREDEQACIVHLPATGGIKRSTIQHDGVLAFAFHGFNHASIEVVEKRIVIVESLGHSFLLSTERSEGPL